MADVSAKLKREPMCPKCYGKGWVFSFVSSTRVCPVCHGAGRAPTVGMATRQAQAEAFVAVVPRKAKRVTRYGQDVPVGSARKQKRK